MMYSSKTQLNAVIGYPLEHTLSPLLHNECYRRLKLNAVLLAFANGNCERLTDAIRTLGISLTAVTIPYKESVIPFLDGIDPVARRIGSVNTIIQRDGYLHGFNTDCIGIQKALQQETLSDTRALIIGAGGAARAAAWVLAEASASVWYYNRTPQRAQAIAKEFGGIVISNYELHQQAFDLIINATSVGLAPHHTQTPLPDFPFTNKHIVFDCVYSPLETRLLREAQSKGAHTISGIDMFLHQALEQIRLWSGRTLPFRPIRKFLITNGTPSQSV